MEEKLCKQTVLETIDLSNDPSVLKPISVSVHLTGEEKEALVSLLKEFRDVFAWSYEEMSGLNPNLVSHTLNIELAMLSFMDGFSGYNQIKMSPKDAEKTAFRTPYGNFYYTVMPFGLKNAVKSKTRGSHQGVLRRVLERCWLYGLKMNPKKCAFGVSSGKFLGFQVHQRGIDVDSEKTKAICSLAPPRNPKELKSFMRRLSYIRRFIPGLAAMMSVFTPLLKKGKPYIWSQGCQEAYQQVQQLITKLPTMRAPIPGLPLKLYLAATNAAVGALLAQDDRDGEESPIYYVSRQLRGAEERYPKTELLCLTLVYAAQRLRHYFLAHKLQLIVKSDPVRYLLTRPVLSGRLAPLFPEIEESTLSEEVLGELPEMVATVTEEEPWTLYFDGSSTSKGGGAGVVLINPNGQATALSFKLDFPCTNNPNITVIRRSTPMIEAMVQEDLLEEDDWRKPLKKNLGKESSIKDLKDYAIIFGELYRRLPGAGLQSKCPTCSTILSTEESFTISFAEDWRAPYLAFFVDGALPTNSKLAYKLKKTMKRYFVDGSTLYQKGFNGEPLKCLGESEARQAMQEIHAGECREHQGMKKLHRQLLSIGYYWPTMKKDAHDFVKKCHTCQIHANLNMRTPWPFHTWGLDLIGTIHPPSDGYIWILTATEYFTKWVEAIPLRKATGAAVSNFIRECIVCRFGIPYKMVTDNGTPFVNKQVSSTLSGYGIKHRRSTPYYPQGNGQAEATNKTILRILSKMIYDATGFSPYSLVYGSEAISPVEITIPTARIAAVNDLEWDTKTCSDWRLLDLKAVDERRMEAERRMALYHKTVAQAYNRTVKPQAFKQGDLVLKVVEHVRRQVSGPSKFAPQWEGPFAVKEVHNNGYYRLISVKEGMLTDPINGKWLKPYYC
ncbi:unnamed protein product [Prunus brigantina]